MSPQASMNICYFGLIISAEGVRLDADKLKAVREMLNLTDIKELIQWLGFINYLSINCTASDHPTARSKLY